MKIKKINLDFNDMVYKNIKLKKGQLDKLVINENNVNAIYTFFKKEYSKNKTIYSINTIDTVIKNQKINLDTKNRIYKLSTCFDVLCVVTESKKNNIIEEIKKEYYEVAV